MALAVREDEDDGDGGPGDGGAGEVAALVARLTDVVQHLREEGLFNVEQFLRAAEGQMGGTLVIMCPSRFKKRAVPEARFASEGFVGSLQQ